MMLRSPVNCRATDTLGMPMPAMRGERDWAAPVVTFDSGLEGNNFMDSDRMFTLNPDKYNQVSRAIFGDESQMWWDQRAEPQIETFLQSFLDKPELKLTKIMKMYNRSNGFPVWHFQFIEGASA